MIRRGPPKVLKLPLNLKISYHSSARRRENTPGGKKAAPAKVWRCKEHGTFRELAIPSWGASHSSTLGICLRVLPPSTPMLRAAFPLALSNPLHCSVRHAQLSSSPFYQPRTPQFCHSLWNMPGEGPFSSLLSGTPRLPPRHLPPPAPDHFSATTRWSPFIGFFCYCQTHPF